MAAKHRKRSDRAKKVAMVSAATATATAMTVNMAAPANALTLPILGDVPVPVVDDVLDPGTGLPAGLELDDLIGDDGLLDLAALPDLAGLEGDLANLIPQGTPLDTTLGALLTLLGVTGVPSEFGGIPVRIITTGPPFTLLKLFGVDIGWTPAIPSQIADEINTTPYLAVPLVSSIRVPVVIAFGLGAFATGLAYPSVVADLPNQPGGAADPADAEESRGSITILPLVLLRNPGRPNGGLFARADPLAQLFGFTTVTPQTSPEQSGESTLLHRPATLLPIMIDATVEYDPLSDFPSWPNPVSLLNSGAALLFPTYILRGSDVSAVLPQIAPLLVDLPANLVVATTGIGEFTDMNYYITVPQDSLPLLEPARLPFDVINLITGLSLSNSFADAIEPALKILVNLGYTDVDQANGYDRTLDQMGVPTPFFTLPENVDWDQVPDDVIQALITGFEDEFFNGTPFVAEPGEALPVNALTAVLSLLNVLGAGDSAEEGPLGDLGGLLDGLLDGIDSASTADTTLLSAEGGDDLAPSGDLGSYSFVDQTSGEGDQDPLLETELDDEDASGTTRLDGELEEDEQQGDGQGTRRLDLRPGVLRDIARDVTSNLLRPLRPGSDSQDDDEQETTTAVDDDDDGDDGDGGDPGDSEDGTTD